MLKNNKILEIKGLYVALYRRYSNKNVLFGRKIVEPAFIQLWFKATENDWDSLLWDQISDKNQDWFSYVYHETNQPPNKELEIAIAKKFKSTQQRLLLIEGNIMNGNLNTELLDEFTQIINKLVESHQLPQKQGTRMKKRIIRTYNQLSDI